MESMPSQSMAKALRPAESHPPLAEWPLSHLLLGGLALAAVGALAWLYVGPDVVRYLKIRNM